MSLIERIDQLNTTPRHQEDEYEYTSDFIEWFYENLCLNTPVDEDSTLYKVTQSPSFNEMREHCMKLMNVQYAKTQDDASLIRSYTDIKQWLVDTVDKYE